MGLGLAVLGGTIGRTAAAIPEPDLVWYGRVLASSGGNVVRLTTGTLTWRIEPVGGGAPIVVATTLANLNDQFSYVLRVPCESPVPGTADSGGKIVLTSPARSYRRVSVTLDGEPLALAGAAATIAPTPADRGSLEQIDLTVGSLPLDSDGDGMSDVWEQQFFGSATAADPDRDEDGDGLSNLREFRAGTHPLDERSRFEILEITRVAEGYRLRWSSVAGRTYRVRRADTLSASVTDYAVVRSDVAATPPLNEWTDTSAGQGGRSFYLVEVAN